MAGEYSKPDFWTRRALSEGYPARSVYKLKEMNERFSLFRRGDAVLDLGAAPGSWSAFVLRQLGGAGRVTAVDILPICAKMEEGDFTFIQGDLFDESVRDRVREGAPYDAVLCDAAPSTTGNRAVDTARSSALVETAMGYAAVMLKSGGNFAAKLFQGSGQGDLLKKLREDFTSARGYKPQACRSGSFEVYLIGLGKR
ncbi:MAG: RlmE family RNA methyltransferase [Spirochaetaceae bacterium]|jgi:23S rRNA (uridine2552-2'-O)-methyltransferase|nr:RlmE family RNA methyltransferase [Spirochaetaceae bacterium]